MAVRVSRRAFSAERLLSRHNSDIQADILAADGVNPWQALQNNRRVRRDIGRRATCEIGEWQGTMGLGSLYLRTQGSEPAPTTDGHSLHPELLHFSEMQRAYLRTDQHNNNAARSNVVLVVSTRLTYVLQYCGSGWN
ncbi:hypothetical protein [Paraburkholderia phytofirmans]|uniref:Uncharacterized protein n=1 Tax=Paraburkholderia phytofirmans TaxID=261302 RepID=A0ABW9BKZ2_9BURK